MSDFEKLLEDVAHEAVADLGGAYLTPLAVLKRRLLPLLEAGQKMYDHGRFGEAHNWDAAKQAALGDGKA